MTKWTAPDIASIRGDNSRPLQKIFGSLTEYLKDYQNTIDTSSSTSSQTFVRNGEATTLTIGTVVYLDAQQGDRATVKRAFNTSDATSAKTLGVVAESIPANADGLVTTLGYVYKCNTSGYTAGQTLYLGSTAGTFTATKPHAPNHMVYVGVVVRANAGNGIIYVRCQNGYELDEIHDVDLITTPPTAGDFLKYNGSLWVAATGPVGATGATGATGAAATLAVGTTTIGRWDAGPSVTNSGTSSAAVFDFQFPDAEPPGFKYFIDTTTTVDEDPGEGYLRLNNVSASAATFVYINDQDIDTYPIAYLISSMGATSGIKGILVLRIGIDSLYFKITGTVQSASGYRKIPVTYLSGVTFFEDELQKTYVGFLPPPASGLAGLARVQTITSSATPTINTNNRDAVSITALSTAITSMTTNLTGTPNNFDRLTFRIKDNGTARAITWGAKFVASGAALPTTTVASKVLSVEFIYDTVKAAWTCVSVAQET